MSNLLKASSSEDNSKGQEVGPLVRKKFGKFYAKQMKILQLCTKLLIHIGHLYGLSGST